MEVQIKVWQVIFIITYTTTKKVSGKKLHFLHPKPLVNSEGFADGCRKCSFFSETFFCTVGTVVFKIVRRSQAAIPLFNRIRMPVFSGLPHPVG